MANKNKRNQIQQANQRRAKQQQYEAATKYLFIFPSIALGLGVISLLLFFVPFAEVYLQGFGPEHYVTGWEWIVACLSDGYTSPNIARGSLSNLFYYFAKEWCEPLAIVTLFSALVLIINLAVQVITVVKKMHVLNAMSALLSLLAVILLIVCYAKGLDMKNARILSDFCQNNPLCSIKSYAIIPAILSIGSCAVSVYATVMHLRASKLLK